VLPKSNRLRSGAEFTRVTKTGHRASSNNLVMYAILEKTLGENQTPKIGFIVNRSVGGSVTRHLVTRKLRHDLASHINQLPKNTMLVVRVLKEQKDYRTEVATSIGKLITKLTKVDA
jgi:ribonuclease P protein component